MKFNKAFVTPVLVATMGILSAVSLGTVGYTTEAHAPDPQMVEIIEEEFITENLALGIVDGLTRKQRADKIDAYFAQYDLPLAGYGMKFVTEADKYGIHWALLASIAMRESTGGKFEFARYNSFGWGKQVDFPNREIAIAHVTKHLAGENPNTSHYYAGKDTEGILARYNSVIPGYTNEILGIMEDIENMEPDERTLLVLNDK